MNSEGAKERRNATEGSGRLAGGQDGPDPGSFAISFVRSPTTSRRDFLRGSIAAALSMPVVMYGADPTPTPDLADRIRGLMYGTVFGDALGGPVEFQAAEAVQRLPDPPRAWKDDELFDEPARTATAERLQLRSYRIIRPGTESYGQWNANAEAGTITDDTRHKLVLLHSLRAAEAAGRWPYRASDLAREYLEWPAIPAVAKRPDYVALAADWLEEWKFAARWVLGERDPARALPPERMWQGLPTCCGQMTLLPVAALFAGRPDDAHRAAWSLAFFDNGIGRDMNAALVAGLAQALVTPVEAGNPRPAWDRVLAAVRNTDPYRHARIRWTTRPVHQWLDFAQRAAREAAGRPARMFARFEREFASNHKWEAHVPFVVTFGCLALAEYDPLAALQLSIEWGHDTDSFASLLGAFVGALHGAGLFRDAWRDTLRRRIKEDFEVDLDDECRLLVRLQVLASGRKLVADP